MALIEIDLMGDVRDKVKIAINRLRSFCPPEGYYVAFSGGKDSVVIKTLCDMAGVKYDAHYNVTTVDPPELVRFIAKEFPDVALDKPEKTMRQLIVEHKVPPTRLMRYCCEALKERRSPGRITVTGVRWAESRNRKDNQGVVTMLANKQAMRVAEEQGVNFTKTVRGGGILNLDNDAARRTVEFCYRTNKTLINPIIDWDDDDVWEFIRSNNIPYCSLYDKGYKRLGCIGCPMGGAAQMKREFERWPAYRRMYIQAFDAAIEERKAAGMTCNKLWTDGEGMMRWWLRDAPKSLPGQMTIDDLEVLI